MLGPWSFAYLWPFDAPQALAYKYLGPFGHCPREALARGSREPGQALTGAAISGVLLCEGPFSAVQARHLSFVTRHQLLAGAGLKMTNDQ